jgi:threonine dehydratase
MTSPENTASEVRPAPGSETDSPGNSSTDIPFTDIPFTEITFTDIRSAAERIGPHVHRTPVVRSHLLDEWAGAELHLKAENLQRVGAFKMRGATNAVLRLDDDSAARGVVAHSSGNHGAALALAARIRGIPARIVMPSNAPVVKVEAVQRYGGMITECEPTSAGREQAVAKLVAETGAVEIHPFDNDHIIAGAGTAALELIEDVAGLAVVIAPVGGGGLLSGTCIAAHALDPSLRLIGGEPAGADDAFRSLAAGTPLPQDDPRTIADGLRTGLSERTFRIISSHVEQIVTVSEEEIIDAMRMIWTRTKLVVEPSGAVPVAAIRKLGLGGARVGVILSGGNVDLDALPWVTA